MNICTIEQLLFWEPFIVRVEMESSPFILGANL